MDNSDEKDLATPTLLAGYGLMPSVFQNRKSSVENEVASVTILPKSIKKPHKEPCKQCGHESAAENEIVQIDKDQNADAGLHKIVEESDAKGS